MTSEDDCIYHVARLIHMGGTKRCVKFKGYCFKPTSYKCKYSMMEIKNVDEKVTAK